MRHLFLSLLILLLVACAPAAAPAPEPVAEPAAFDFSGAHVRVRNATNQTLADVTLTANETTAALGALDHGQTSEFHTFAPGLPPSITAQVDGAPAGWLSAADAEPLVAGGEYTFELTLEGTALVPAVVMENPVLRDAQQYADDLGLSLEQAARQLTYQDAVGKLDAALTAGEPETFAGLWIEHEPAYRVVVAFTRDGRETLEQYVGPEHSLAALIDVRPATYSLAELQADQAAAQALLEAAGFRAGSGIDVQENHVELLVSDPGVLQDALAAVAESLPASVVPVTVSALGGDGPAIPLTPVPEVYMAQLKTGDVETMAALLEGTLVVEEGCLRLAGESESHLIIWQPGYYLTAAPNDSGDGVAVVNDGGEVVARSGMPLALDGGEVPGVDQSELEAPVPGTCSGPYWRMGGIVPEQ